MEEGSVACFSKFIVHIFLISGRQKIQQGILRSNLRTFCLFFHSLHEFHDQECLLCTLMGRIKINKGKFYWISRSKNSKQQDLARIIIPMKNTKALIVILLIGLTAWLGVTNFMPASEVVAEQKIETPVASPSAEPLTAGPARKLFIFPLLGSLLQAKVGLIGGLFGLGGGLFGHGASSSVDVQPSKGNFDSGRITASGDSGRISSISSGVNLRRNFNFDGRFAMSLPRVPMEVNNNEFIFRGCNTFRIPYLFDKAQFLFGRVQSTRNDCGDFDFPSTFVSLLGRVAKLGRNKDTNDVLFFTNKNRHLFTAGWRKQLNRAPLAGQINDGLYDAQFPSYNVEVKGNKMWFQGCENDPLEFLYDDTGRVQFVKTFYGEEDCFVNQYEFLTDVFRNSERARYSNDGSWYSFEDASGNGLIRCDRHDW